MSLIAIEEMTLEDFLPQAHFSVSATLDATFRVSVKPHMASTIAAALTHPTIPFYY